jgi:tetratricopeptide (TPR) repeat protein
MPGESHEAPRSSPRPPGLRIRPGAVRQARTDAGLSLRELAGGRISRTALHLIETGRTRPTQPTLELIAERTGKPLEFFLQPGEQELLAPHGESRDLMGELIELELAVERGTLQRAADLSGRLIAASTGSIRATAHLHAGQAHLRLAHLEEARSHVAEALAFFTETDDRSMISECLDWQAAILHQAGDPAALEVAERALGFSQQVRPAPIRTRVRILSRIGAIHASYQRWAEAIRSYEAATSAGSALQDLSRVSDVYSELSVAYRRLNRLADARRHELYAVHVHQLLNDRIAVARAETNLALALMRLGQLEEARSRLERALTMFDAERRHRERIHVLLAMANLSLMRGELDEARDFAEQAGEQARRLRQRALVTDANDVLERIAARREG